MKNKRILSMILVSIMILSSGLNAFAQIDDIDKHWADASYSYRR